MAAGRQREFDKQVALDAAMNVFWLNGYTGTSLSDLTDAMGINKPSLYSAFGNKQALFISALEHYVSKHGTPHVDELHTPNRSLRSRLRAYLNSVARMVCDPLLPGGCFVASSTSEAGGDCLPAAASQTVARINELTRKAFVEFFRHEVAAGNVPSEGSAEVWANYLLTLQYGLAVMARNRADREQLEGIIEHAVATF